MLLKSIERRRTIHITIRLTTFVGATCYFCSAFLNSLSISLRIPIMKSLSKILDDLSCHLSVLYAHFVSEPMKFSFTCIVVVVTVSVEFFFSLTMKSGIKRRHCLNEVKMKNEEN